MKAFRAIVALTFRNAVRSHIFQLLLLLLLLCVTVIPLSISVGKTEEFIRVSLLYSLWAVSIILSLSSLWLGCYVMSHDIDSYQIHMVISKPVSRITVWLGKWAGINLINLVLLFVSGAIVYGAVMMRYRSAGEEGQYAERQLERDNAAAARERIRSRILVGRRSFMPRQIDPERAAEFHARRRKAELEKEGKQVSDADLIKMRDEIREQIDRMPVEVRSGEAFRWIFENVPEDLNKESLTLRYRPYLGKVSSEDQRESYILWSVMVPYRSEGGNIAMYRQPLSQRPEQYFTGVFHEKELPPGIISGDGRVFVEVVNMDVFGGKHFYQHADGPKLLVPVCSFEMNYLRALLVMTIQLLLLSGLACSFGGFLTMPTAIFMVASYLLFGALSVILTDSEFFVASVWDRTGQMLAAALLKVIIPLQNFDVTDLLSGGDLIEFSLIGELFCKYFLLRGMPLFLLGIWLYCRREMGSAVRK